MASVVPASLYQPWEKRTLIDRFPSARLEVEMLNIIHNLTTSRNTLIDFVLALVFFSKTLVMLLFLFREEAFVIESDL